MAETNDKPTRSKVVFNVAIEEELKAPVPVKRGELITHPEIQVYLEAMRIAGYDENAIVVRRCEPMYSRRQHENWGIIQKAWRYKQTQATEYIPFEVIWFKNGDVTKEWAEPLMVVHASQTFAQLDASFSTQSEPVKS